MKRKRSGWLLLRKTCRKQRLSFDYFLLISRPTLHAEEMHQVFVI